MSELSQKIKQCRKPAGEQGKQIAAEMNESHYALTSWGLDKIPIRPDSVILDVGCGGGRTIDRMAARASEGKVIGIDYSPDCVAWSRTYNKKWVKQGRVKILQAAVNKLPFDDNHFDIVTAVETVYFWPDLTECFNEIKRVLKPSGKFIIINEMYKSEAFREKNDTYAAAGDMQIFAPEELKNWLEKLHFLNVKIEVVEANNWLCCIGEK